MRNPPPQSNQPSTAQINQHTSSRAVQSDRPSADDVTRKVSKMSAVTTTPKDDVISKSHTDTKTSNGGSPSEHNSNNNLEGKSPAVPSVLPSSEGAVISFPQVFEVKYLGKRDAGGLWGIKHTRRPVDEMVAAAKELKPGETLPFLRMDVSDKGVLIAEMPKNINKDFEGGFYPIEVISYGVQDLVYTRVFAMIIVQEEATTTATHPFHCHAFVCDSRQSARHLTFALAQAFQQFSKQVKGKGKKPKKFAIDLRPAEEKEADLRDMDSEA